jgi:molybdate transport system substrate-binding protein
LVRDRLGRAGTWERLAARAVVFKPTVGEVANDLRLGTADAAFVWDATVAQTPGLEEVKVPELAGAEALVAVAVLRSSRQPEAARAFARYLMDPDHGGAEFRRRGYRTP